MRILTGNDLGSGHVVWWDGQSWSRYVNDAVDVGDAADGILAAEEAARRVNASYAIAATKAADGTVTPDHIKDQIRARGPSVRPDLALEPSDPLSGNWVI